MNEGFTAITEAIERTGRYFRVRNGELTTRCPICGDSPKSAYHTHLYINLEPPHKWFCQRCNARGMFITEELLEALNAAESSASVYVRGVVASERLSGRSRRGRASLAVGRNARLRIPPPDPNCPEDMAAMRYLEKRIGGDPLSAKELERYKVVTCGLYGFLRANGITELSLDPARQIRELDRLNETCVGFLTADESYIIFRSIDDEYVKSGGTRYTGYRIYPSWEGSKSFACRADVSSLAPVHNVVCAEGIIDLIQTERVFYPERRWDPSHVGVATCGSAHATVLRQLLSLGMICQNVDLYIDDEPKTLAAAKKLRLASPFFQTPHFNLQVFRNAFAHPDHRREKDMGVPREFIRRVQVAV